MRLTWWALALAIIPGIGTSRAAVGDRLDRSGLTPTFIEDFSHLSLFDPRSAKGRWKTNYDFGDQQGASSRALGDELQIYADPDFDGVDPFITTNGHLTIVARRRVGLVDPRRGDKEFTSGLLTTSRSFLQRYGYFEMRAALPQAPGLWPAFWLAAPLNPATSAPQFPGEIDVMEMLARDPQTIYCSAHWPLDRQASRAASKIIPVHAGGTASYRTYGVLWTDERLSWFIDGVEVAEIANPGLHRPMMILIDLAIGGGWGGPPTARTGFPARMKVDFVHAYAVSPGRSTVSRGGLEEGRSP